MADARQPLSYDSIENSMRAVMNRLTVLTKEHEQAQLDAAESEANFKVEFAVARTRFRNDNAGTKITQDSAEDFAVVETLELRRKHLLDTAIKLAKKRALETCDGQLEALRSLMSSHRKALE